MADVGDEIGFGLAMEDPMGGAPYFYIAGYPSDGSIEYNDLPNLRHGRWEIGDWNGGLLPLTELETMSKSEAMDAITGFIDEATNWYLR